MPLAKMPDWPPLELPAPAGSLGSNTFQALTEEFAADADAMANQAGLDLAGTSGALMDAQAAADALGQSLAAGASELDDQDAEAAADTLESQISAAADQDATLAATQDDLSRGLSGAGGSVPNPPVTDPPTTPPISGPGIGTVIGIVIGTGSGREVPLSGEDIGPGGPVLK